MNNIREIADQADVIIDGYAVLKKENDEYAVVNLNRPGHAAVFKKNGTVVETSMDDIELSIAANYLTQSLKYISEGTDAEVLRV